MPLVQSLLATNAWQWKPAGDEQEREVRSGSCVAQSGTTALYYKFQMFKSQTKEVTSVWSATVLVARFPKKQKFHIGKYPQCHVNQILIYEYSLLLAIVVNLP